MFLSKHIWHISKNFSLPIDFSCISLIVIGTVILPLLTMLLPTSPLKNLINFSGRHACCWEALSKALHENSDLLSSPYPMSQLEDIWSLVYKKLSGDYISSRHLDCLAKCSQVVFPIHVSLDVAHINFITSNQEYQSLQPQATHLCTEFLQQKLLTSGLLEDHQKAISLILHCECSQEKAIHQKNCLTYSECLTNWNPWPWWPPSLFHSTDCGTTS